MFDDRLFLFRLIEHLTICRRPFCAVSSSFKFNEKRLIQTTLLHFESRKPEEKIMFGIESLIGLKSSSETSQAKTSSTSTSTSSSATQSLQFKKPNPEDGRRSNAEATVTSSAAGSVSGIINSASVSMKQNIPIIHQPVPHLLTVHQQFAPYSSIANSTTPWWLLHTPSPYDLAIMTRKAFCNFFLLKLRSFDYKLTRR